MSKRTKHLKTKTNIQLNFNGQKCHKCQNGPTFQEIKNSQKKYIYNLFKQSKILKFNYWSKITNKVNRKICNECKKDW